MKIRKSISPIIALVLLGLTASAQKTDEKLPQKVKLFIDVHHMGAGKITLVDIQKAQREDSEAQKNYGVSFLHHWIDETEGNVYCLSSAADSASVKAAHTRAQIQIPDQIFQVNSGKEAEIVQGKDYFLDIHNFGAGNVKAADVVGVHEKDLAKQSTYGVNFINYWVNEAKGKVFCLSQAPDSTAVIKTHQAAHGHLPSTIEEVKPDTGYCCDFTN